MMSLSTGGGADRGAALRLMHLAVRFHINPQHDMHSSWYPRGWPARLRGADQFSTAGQQVLARSMRTWSGLRPPYQFDFGSRIRRLALIESASLRRLAHYCGLSVHRALLKRPVAGLQARRQAARLHADASRFVMNRVPELPMLNADLGRALEHPHGVGRLMSVRGYRLLKALLSTEGNELWSRVRYKLPRRAAELSAAPLNDDQLTQLDELIFMCLVPERLQEWDWLF